jgi:DNA-binding MarR family transcriptional regulator
MSDDLRHLADVDRLVHEPSRLIILAILNTVEQVDFTYLLNETGLTRGNLSTHLSKLEAAQYILIEKTFRGKIPQTLVSITATGRLAFENYRKNLSQLVEKISEDKNS